MIILNVLQIIFKYLFPIALISSLFTKKVECFQENKDGEDARVENTNEKWKVIIKALLAIFTLILLFGGTIWIIMKYKITWLIFILCTSLYMEGLSKLYVSIGIIKNVVNSNEKLSLSVREQTAIETTAYMWWFLELYNLSEKILNYAVQYPNAILSDLLVIISYIVLFFIYIFLICALIPTLILRIVNILQTIVIHFSGKEKIKKYGDYFIGRIDKTDVQKIILIELIETIGTKKYFWRFLGVIIIPIVSLIDISVCLYLIMKSLLFSTIGYFVLLIRLIEKTAKVFLSWIPTVSNKFVIAVAFRVAIIMALVFTVILNRYMPFLKEYDASTAVLEFIAGTIIIPILFEWIYSLRKK